MKNIVLLKEHEEYKMDLFLYRIDKIKSIIIYADIMVVVTALTFYVAAFCTNLSIRCFILLFFINVILVLIIMLLNYIEEKHREKWKYY